RLRGEPRPPPVVVGDRRGLRTEELADTGYLLPLRIRQQLLVGIEIGRQQPVPQIGLRRRWQLHFGGHGVLSCLCRFSHAFTIGPVQMRRGCRVDPVYWQGTGSRDVVERGVTLRFPPLERDPGRTRLPL